MSRIYLLPTGNVLDEDSEDYEKKVSKLRKRVNVRKSILENSGVKRESVKKSFLMGECKKHKGEVIHDDKDKKKLKELNLILDTHLLTAQRDLKALKNEIENLKKQEKLFEEKFIRLYNKYINLEKKYNKLLKK